MKRRTYVGFALDEIARRRTRRARLAARNAAVLQEQVENVVELHREKPSALTEAEERMWNAIEKAIAESEEVEGHGRP